MVVDREVAGSPESYRSYIQYSRGEFSCVKPSCIHFSNAWVSDRTLCYLSSGKPAVVHDTGSNTWPPSGEGFFRFSTIDEAVAALHEIHSNYKRHPHAARELAEASFDAKRAVADIIDVALGELRPKPSPQPTAL
jgi:hypothetical protein